MCRPKVGITLSAAERQELEGLARRRNPRPFRWTKSTNDILATIKRFCLRTLDTAQRQHKLIKTSESGH